MQACWSWPSLYGHVLWFGWAIPTERPIRYRRTALLGRAKAHYGREGRHMGRHLITGLVEL